MTKKKTAGEFERQLLNRMSNFVKTLQQQSDLPGKLTMRTIRIAEPTIAWKPKKIAELRESLGASQVIFAILLGVSVKTVHAWEQGINKPSGIACRFLSEIQHDPAHWKKRLAELATVRPAG